MGAIYKKYDQNMNKCCKKRVRWLGWLLGGAESSLNEQRSHPSKRGRKKNAHPKVNKVESFSFDLISTISITLSGLISLSAIPLKYNLCFQVLKGHQEYYCCPAGVAWRLGVNP